ncbi:hypothetical protein E2C01_083966 [Portunus trituberculatus]|uniref:Uncharacterized protein n=1 Tax=Portunus trituberculatus TaxID=210409 RepID=A0A5B7J7Y2_PORTR|nr:hypothetical protein [Portunus trituberculatus]
MVEIVSIVATLLWCKKRLGYEELYKRDQYCEPQNCPIKSGTAEVGEPRIGLCRPAASLGTVANGVCNV